MPRPSARTVIIAILLAATALAAPARLEQGFGLGPAPAAALAPEPPAPAPLAALSPEPAPAPAPLAALSPEPAPAPAPLAALSPEPAPAPAPLAALSPEPAPAPAPLAALSDEPVAPAPVTAGPDFTLSISPTVVTISSGDRARYEVEITAVEGFTGSITLSVPRVPQRAIVRFPRNPVTPGTPTEFYIETTVATAPGTYTMTLAAEGPGGNPLHTATFRLVIPDESLYSRILRFLFFGGLNSAVAVTLQITTAGIALALVIGLIIGLLRTSKNPFLFGFGTVYVEVIRGIPMLVLLFYVYFGLSDLIVTLAASIVGEGVVMPLEPVPAAILGLGLGYGAYMGETYRSGIQSIHRGQMEAARSLGMSYFQSMIYIILPQAIRRILPPLVNDMSAMLKDSALASALGVAEMARLTREFSSLTFRPFEAWTVAAILYFFMTSFFSQLGRYLEKRMAVD